MAVKPGLEQIFAPYRVKYKDIFDLKQFYDDLHQWLLENRWTDVEEGNERWETYYGERIDREGAREIWFFWRLKQEVIDAPFTYYLDIDFHCLGIVNTEVVKNGKKMKMNKGEVEMKMKSFLEKNYEKDLKGNFLIKHFIKLFNKRVYRKEIEQKKKELYQETYRLLNFMKQWFKLKRYLPYEESKNFYPSVAYPSHLKE